jgi:hypothetical protein
MKGTKGMIQSTANTCIVMHQENHPHNNVTSNDQQQRMTIIHTTGLEQIKIMQRNAEPTTAIAAEW